MLAAGAFEAEAPKPVMNKVPAVPAEIVAVLVTVPNTDTPLLLAVPAPPVPEMNTLAAVVEIVD